jgi:acyl-CoA synthetase (AMP-forming)/AMP-acid ligase II
MTHASEIVDRFHRVVRDAPDRPSVYLPAIGAVLTAADVWDTHLRFRVLLTRHGLAPNLVVISAAANRASAVPLLLACLAERIVLLPVDGGATRADIDDLQSRFRAAAAIVPASLVRPDDRSVPLDADLHLVHASSAADAPVPIGDAAVLKLTSGSTGRPKAIVIGERHLLRDGERIVAGMGIGGTAPQIAVIPLSHSYGLGNLVLPLLLQGTPIVLRDAFLPQQMIADARAVGAAALPGVPFMFAHVLSNPPAGGWPPSLRLLISAGAPLDAGTIRQFRRRFGCTIHQFYGSSETGGIAYDADDDPSDEGCVGRALPGVTIAVRHDPDAPDGSGRIHVGSDAVARGYLGDDTNRGAFAGGGFLTGDFGRTDATGRLWLTGRTASFINVAGRKVQPAEVERALRSMPGVDQVCVVGVPDRRRGQRIAACVVAVERMTAVDIRRFCAARMAAHKIPRSILFLDALPVTARGKLDRSRAAQMVGESVADGK